MKFRKGRIKSVQSRAQHTFAQVPTATIPRSSFNRSHGHKTTFDEGYLVPFYADEVLPGDTFNLRMTAFGRMATPIFPIMDNLYFDMHFFFVPNRLVWSNWERFNGAQDNPTDSTSFVIPILDDTVAPMSTTGFLSSTIYDYLGLPVLVPAAAPGDFPVNALPLRAYNLIYNTWYRDENLQNSVTVSTTNGPDTPANYALLRRGKRHDYFTSCLPWPQKVNDGSTLNVPLGGTASVVTTGTAPTFTAGTNPAGILGVPNGSNPNIFWSGNNALGNEPLIFASTGLEADLSTATGVTINELREAFQIQKMFERDARGGTRYTEIIHSHFGVISPDMRLQRPEYLGGGSTAVNHTPVPQTSVTAATPQGNLAAFSTFSLNRCGFVKSFTEHGYILGIGSVRADLNYQQGLHRMWSRSTRYDFYWPSLSHIGEQAVLTKELMFQGNGATNDLTVFGYQERFGEYRYFPGKITGLFRSAATGTFDAWHLAQSLAATPALNATFIVENAPMTRVIATNTDPHFIFDSFFDLRCARPMPVYGVPGLIDHF
nr:MAG: major capsid protein [Microviridae sp.]